MSRKTQVSIRGETYSKVKDFCDKEGIPVSRLIDAMCANYFNPRSSRKGGLDHRDILF